MPSDVLTTGPDTLTFGGDTLLDGPDGGGGGGSSSGSSMSPDLIIVQNITISDKAPTRPSFGIMLLLGYHTRWLSDFYRLYSDTDDMLTDGFLTTDALYQAALVAKEQDPAPAQIMIGRRATALTQTVTLTPTVTTQGYIYSGTIAGQVFTYTVPGSATVATICAALTALIDPFTNVACTNGTTLMTVTSSVAGNTWDFTIGAGLDIADITPDTQTGTDLAAVDAQLDGQIVSWYGLVVVDSQSKATALLQAAYVEAQKKLSLVQSPDSAILNPSSTTDTAFAVQNAAYNRTGVVYHRNIGGTEWLASGMVGGRFCHDPGEETWAFKTVVGTTPDILKGGGKTAAAAKNCNVYVKSHGLPIFYEGKAGSGRYLDTTRFVDWQTSTIDFDVFTLLYQSPKVPFTNKGLSSIGLVIQGSIQKGQIAGGVSDDPADAPVIVTQKVAQTDVSDRALRIAKGFSYQYRLSGAVHAVVIKGTVTV